MHYENTIKGAGIEEEQQKFNEKVWICANVIDEKKIDTIPTTFGKMSMDEVINESDEFAN